MTDKEKIIIDGADVSQCEFYIYYFSDKYPNRCGIHKDMFGMPACCDVADCCKNCYYKQLKRKEQECELMEIAISIKDQRNEDYSKALADKSKECEKWKEKWNIGFQKFCDKDNELQHYKQALKEIKSIVSSTLDCGEWIGQGDNKMENILDIINKAKENNQ